MVDWRWSTERKTSGEEILDYGRQKLSKLLFRFFANWLFSNISIRYFPIYLSMKTIHLTQEVQGINDDCLMWRSCGFC